MYILVPVFILICALRSVHQCDGINHDASAAPVPYHYYALVESSKRGCCVRSPSGPRPGIDTPRHEMDSKDREAELPPLFSILFSHPFPGQIRYKMFWLFGGSQTDNRRSICTALDAAATLVSFIPNSTANVLSPTAACHSV